MKTRKVPTALENYELLKLNRIQTFNKRAYTWIQRGVFVVILVIVIVIKMLISKAQAAPVSGEIASHQVIPATACQADLTGLSPILN